MFYLSLKRAAARAGVPYGQHVEGGFRPHDNRHTAVTRMLQGGADAASVADVVGHSKLYMTLRYSHASPESKRAAVEKLG
jgi:integrase